VGEGLTQSYELKEKKETLEWVNVCEYSKISIFNMGNNICDIKHGWGCNKAYAIITCNNYYEGTFVV
jgi:hypothetical protein